MRNLKSQQNLQAQMEAQYEAEGQIELFWAIASDLDGDASLKEGKIDSQAAINGYIDYLKSKCPEESSTAYFKLLEDINAEQQSSTDGGNTKVYKLTMKVAGFAENKAAAVQTTISAELTTYESSNAENTQTFTMLKSVELSYDAYEAVDPTQLTQQGGA